MTKLSSRRASKKSKKSSNTSPKKSLNLKKMKNKTFETKSKRSSDVSSEKTWTDKRKPTIVSLNAEGNFKSLVSQARSEPMPVTKVNPGLLSTSAITMTKKRRCHPR